MPKSPPDAQKKQWDVTFQEEPDLYGTEPSHPATKAAELFKREEISKILELGAGQGRDTFFFAGLGLQVHALEYSSHGVAAISEKTSKLENGQRRVLPLCHDARKPLPFADATFDACYSHMLYNMAFTTKELEALSGEILRVLKPGGLNIYTARHTGDGDYRAGIHHGEDLYESGGFIVHFFSREKVAQLARGYELLKVEEFDEGRFPRKLFLVVLRKPAS